MPSLEYYFNFDGITPIPGELGRFWVTSDTNPLDTYTVDISEHEGNGACSCPNFFGAKTRAINEGKPLFTHWTSCKHLIRVRNYMAISMFREFARAIKAREQEPDPLCPPVTQDAGF